MIKSTLPAFAAIFFATVIHAEYTETASEFMDSGFNNAAYADFSLNIDDASVAMTCVDGDLLVYINMGYIGYSNQMIDVRLKHDVFGMTTEKYRVSPSGKSFFVLPYRDFGEYIMSTGKLAISLVKHTGERLSGSVLFSEWNKNSFRRVLDNCK